MIDYLFANLQKHKIRLDVLVWDIRHDQRNGIDWRLQNAPSLFEQENVSFSNGEEFRFKLLDQFNSKCKAGKFLAL